MADEKKMLSSRLTLIARHLSRSPAALISTRKCQFSVNQNQKLTVNHRGNMYRTEERGAPNTLEHRIFFREFAIFVIIYYFNFLINILQPIGEIVTLKYGIIPVNDVTVGFRKIILLFFFKYEIMLT